MGLGDPLEAAVAELFRLNNYEVTGPMLIDSASIDLMAMRIGDPFAQPIFVEITTEYVDNTKYGKDLTKFVVARQKYPDSRCILLSSSGFTQSVVARSPEFLTCMRYEELVAQFEKFFPYEQSVLSEGSLAEELSRLAEVYEPPNFDELGGTLAPALEQLVDWCSKSDAAAGWLVVVGEYGTGKTALTQMLLRELMARHRDNPAAPIPIRIELRDFTKQFDADSLLHKFLDDNRLGHVPLGYFTSLIEKGRIVLLLDGYDEMAQYMHLLERRVCLEALARLGRSGARGILTSRPNYFSEAEELQVMETLYASLSTHGVSGLREYARESELDELFERQFVNRHERRLQDLDESQTRHLVERKLAGSPQQVAVVLELLSKVSRPSEDGVRSLGGKPVIISYLVALADELADGPTAPDLAGAVTEYQCFRMIVDQLMIRDRNRSPAMPMDSRRDFLRKMAMRLSASDLPFFSEDDFLGLIETTFSKRLDRLLPSERQNEKQTLLADLRSSATLTRVTVGGAEGWRFSHNSLREFLAVEHLLASLASESSPVIS